MKNLHFKNSYNTWSLREMFSQIDRECLYKYGSTQADIVLNRTYRGMYIEWYLHNIGYWLTLPFIKNKNIETINRRFKDLDLEEHKGSENFHSDKWK